MKLLMTPSEVANRAFGGEDNVRMEFITPAAILSAQRKFLRPVLGGLHDALEEGKYRLLLDGLVKESLAQWVKFLILPALSAQTGVLGVVQYGGEGFRNADDKALARLLKRTHSDADSLMAALVEHIEKSPEEYPEYSISDNIRNVVGIVGGIVL